MHIDINKATRILGDLCARPTAVSNNGYSSCASKASVYKSAVLAWDSAGRQFKE